MRYLFLDIDGVLNTEMNSEWLGFSYIKTYEKLGYTHIKTTATKGMEILVKRLKEMD